MKTVRTSSPTLDSDEELDAVYDLFVESLFDDDESDRYLFVNYPCGVA